MHTKIYSATTIGVQAYIVSVEVDLSLGMLQFFIVGLPDAAIKESKQRIVTALKNSGIKLPERKITVNLAPADLKKEGTLFDLPIAVGILQAAKHIQCAHSFLEETVFLGELSLDGSIRPIKGALAIAYDAQKAGKKRLIVPHENAQEAAIIKDIEIIGVSNVVELINYLRQEITMQPTEYIPFVASTPKTIDFNQVKGQHQAKRALTIAAAGNHNILFMGPPGAGKTMLAKRLATIMPELSFDEMIQTSKIYSISGKLLQHGLMHERPFRNPHHTISQAGLVGGGSFPQPGEISLAHNGILFLDELTEFKRETLEVLRQPLENKTVCIARANHAISFPASFLLVAALNPCPCGFLGDAKKACLCSKNAIEKYLKKLSGPLLDRIDLQVTIKSVDYDTVADTQTAVSSSCDLREKVNNAVTMQRKRFGIEKYNGTMDVEQIEKYCTLPPDAAELVKKAFELLNLSMRGYHKLLKIARTIADLEQSEHIQSVHVKEALFYRSMDQHLEKLRG